ncbi:MAG: TraB/GumN family protein [Desulfomicrobiaceae bacterium]|nr:TraB/GumN family protein [Desulfomicrobiaceae bacterium]
MTATDSSSSLPASVTSVTLPGRTVYLVGTAHVSRQSVDDVRHTVHAVDPDTVCVELCPARYQSLSDPESWRRMDVYRVIRQGKAAFLLMQLILQAMYRRIGDRLGVQPGAEMLAAVELARTHGAQLVLADRDVQVTLKRVWGGMGWWTKMRFFGQLLWSIFDDEEVDTASVERLKESDALTAAMAELAEGFPEIKARLIDERDRYLAEKIRQASGERIVAVVGAGHVPGIVRHIEEPCDLAPLEKVPSPSPWGRVVAWLIPALIVALVVLGFFRGGAALTGEAVLIWFGVHGTLSALGAAVALGHPLAVLSALVASPFTSLNPMIAAGWVAGLVQAWARKPTVADLEALPQSILTVRGFWTNPVSRILLVVVFANIGSSLGTFISGGWIFAKVL